MIKSMTGYADCETNKSDVTVNIEIKSYNSRYLDIVVKTAREYMNLENRIKSLISGYIQRGRIEIYLNVVDESEKEISFEIKERKAAELSRVINSLKDRFDINAAVSLNFLYGTGNIIKPVESEINFDLHTSLIEESIKQALELLADMRGKEGAFIGDDINHRLCTIEKKVEEINKLSDNLTDFYLQRLKERIAVLTKGVIEPEPERIIQEAAFLADKSDISEEITRLKSHIMQFRKIIDSDEPAGMKLNFLLQEFNREFNTIGSKGGKSEISHLVVEAKSELEKIREQVQNVE